MEQGGFFSASELESMSSGLCPPAPAGYVLPTAFPNISKAARIAFDFETKDPKLATHGNGVYRKDGFIVGGAIAAWDSSKRCICAEYYPVAARNGPNLDREHVYQYFRDQLNFFEGELVGTNLLYDGDWMQSVGITPVFAKWRDVQWAEALIDEMAFNYKLETLAQKYLRLGKVTEQLKNLYGPDYIKRFDEVHPGHARQYGIGDVKLPSLILDEQYKKLKSLGMLDLFNLESRLTPLLLYMRKQGVRVDEERALHFKQELIAKRTVELKRLSDLSGTQFTEENLGDKKFLEYAFAKMGIAVSKSKIGDISVTDTWLHNLCKCKKKDNDGNLIDDSHCGHPGRTLELINKYRKAENTSIDGYVFDHAVNGRIHGEFHPLRKSDDNTDAGTESGRFSGKNPNLQNIPTRDKEIGPMCRSMFVPEEGAEWWCADYSQIEFRFLVHMASIMPEIKGGSPEAVRRHKSFESVRSVIQMYKDNPKTDFHQALSDLVSKVIGRSFPRKDAKNLNFSLVYGSGLQLLAETLNMLDENGKPNDKVKELMETYHNAAPFVKDIYDHCIHEAATLGEIRTILNRRSQFDFWVPAFISKGQKRPPELPFDQAFSLWGPPPLIVRTQAHKGLNRKLQGSAADMLKKGMVVAWEAGVFSSTKDFAMSITVHDELDGSIFPTKRGRECFAELVNIMQTCMPLNLPVLVSTGTGKNWAEAK